MIIYKVFDDEWEQIMGEQQVIDLALSQVFNCTEDYREDNLKLICTEYEKILEVVTRILNGYIGITIEQAKMLLNIRCFDIKEIEIY